MSTENNPLVSVIVPARNEEACLGLCLESLVAQTGIDFEIIVVDDASTDRTAEIARSFSTDPVGAALQALPSNLDFGAGVTARHQLTVLSAPPLPDNWTGKNNAMSTGAKITKGKWLLFTDADTVHKPGSLARAVAEAEQHGAALLSYSPEQEVRTFWEKAVMPVIFAELAATYPPKKMNDPASPVAAANGQYLLISREAYDAVGGHTKIASDLLEDVAMARVVKFSGRKIFFRYGGDAVRTRMYRSWAQLKEGWTKNLALLFASPWGIACWPLSEFILLFSLAIGAIELPVLTGLYRPLFFQLIMALCVLFFFWRRIRGAHFSWQVGPLSIFGLPIFAYLLFRSVRLQKSAVTWKVRAYKTRPSGEYRLESNKVAATIAL